MTKIDLQEIKEKLTKVLDQKRYEHTIGVADTAANLAFTYGVDFQKAYLAGLLHDCAKCYSLKKRIKLCKKFGVDLSETELKSPSLIHAKLGAVLAKEYYAIDDNEICEAISYHTTGKPAMSKLEQIVFCADFIEPGRKILNCLPEIRSIIYKDIDHATYLILKQTIIHLEHQNQAIDSMTEKAKEYYERYV